MFNLQPFDKEFSTNYIKAETPSFRIDEDSGLFIRTSDADEFLMMSISYLKRKLTRHWINSTLLMRIILSMEEHYSTKQ